MNIARINFLIEKNICYKTINSLKDVELLPVYIKCGSVKAQIKVLENVLMKNHVDEEKKKKIIDDYIFELIPPGTKGVIRGNTFNKIVKDFILDMDLDLNKFKICFEEKCNIQLTSEVPDFYILEKKSNKVIIGMNQIDIWSGGQQLNRGYKYIVDNKHNSDKSKLLCVICGNPELKSDKNKKFKLFEIGFQNDTLCYLGNLDKIIKSYFKL